MNLEQFCSGRLVVLRPTATAYDAARAMDNNHVGALLVMDKKGLAGIVTDRDVALKIAGGDLLASRIPLRQVMTPNPMTLDTTDSVDQALRVMHALHVRRLVILDDGHPAGIVTLDDLILARAAHPNRLREVVFAQLSDRSGAKPEGFTRPQRLRRRARGPELRRTQHRQQTLKAFTTKVKELTGLAGDDEARVAFEVVAGALARRLTPEEASDFLAQLPALVRDHLEQSSRRGPDRNVTRRSIERAMAKRLKIWPQRAAELVSRIGRGMGTLVSPGEVKHVRGQLPAELKPLLRSAA